MPTSRFADITAASLISFLEEEDPSTLWSESKAKARFEAEVQSAGLETEQHSIETRVLKILLDIYQSEHEPTEETVIQKIADELQISDVQAAAIVFFYNLSGFNLGAPHNLRILSSVKRLVTLYKARGEVDYYLANITQKSVVEMLTDSRYRVFKREMTTGLDIYARLTELDLSIEDIWRSHPRFTAIESAVKRGDPLDQIASEYQVGPAALENFSHYMGWRFSALPWNSEEIDYLRAHYGIDPIEDLCNALQRTGNSISAQATTLGLTRPTESRASDIAILPYGFIKKDGFFRREPLRDFLLNNAQLSDDELAKQLECDPSNIRRWIRKLGIVRVGEQRKSVLQTDAQALAREFARLVAGPENVKIFVESPLGAYDLARKLLKTQVRSISKDSALNEAIKLLAKKIFREFPEDQQALENFLSDLNLPKTAGETFSTPSRKDHSAEILALLNYLRNLYVKRFPEQTSNIPLGMHLEKNLRALLEVALPSTDFYLVQIEDAEVITFTEKDEGAYGLARKLLMFQGIGANTDHSLERMFDQISGIVLAEFPADQALVRDFVDVLTFPKSAGSSFMNQRQKTGAPEVLACLNYLRDLYVRRHPEKASSIPSGMHLKNNLQAFLALTLPAANFYVIQATDSGELEIFMSKEEGSYAFVRKLLLSLGSIFSKQHFKTTIEKLSAQIFPEHADDQQALNLFFTALNLPKTAGQCFSSPSLKYYSPAILALFNYLRDLYVKRHPEKASCIPSGMHLANNFEVFIETALPQASYYLFQTTDSDELDIFTHKDEGAYPLARRLILIQGSIVESHSLSAAMQRLTAKLFSDSAEDRQALQTFVADLQLAKTAGSTFTSLAQKANSAEVLAFFTYARELYVKRYPDKTFVPAGMHLTKNFQAFLATALPPVDFYLAETLESEKLVIFKENEEGAYSLTRKLLMAQVRSINEPHALIETMERLIVQLFPTSLEDQSALRTFVKGLEFPRTAGQGFAASQKSGSAQILAFLYFAKDRWITLHKNEFEEPVLTAAKALSLETQAGLAGFLELAGIAVPE